MLPGRAAPPRAPGPKPQRLRLARKVRYPGAANSRPMRGERPRAPFRGRASRRGGSRRRSQAARARMFFRPCRPGCRPRRSRRRRRGRTRSARRPRCPITTSARRASACLRTFASPSCTMRKTSICSSGASRIAVVDLEVDLELAVGGEEVDVAAQRGVERRRCRPRTRARGSRSAPPAARPRPPPSAARASASGRRPASSIARVRRDGEEVLREPVVDLARDARPLLRDRAPELGVADRPPDADEQDPVGEQPQEVALRDEVARERRREDVVQLGEERQRRAEREPAVEVVAVARGSGGRTRPARRGRGAPAAASATGQEQRLVVAVGAVERRQG